ncbi:MAG: hypothetical protein PUI85_00020 [Eubacteriales bacterium]|nr:hypothetical protein [Eubacteriales bacterium]MDY3332205.1 hypothetical protein [Gallibacter sp.]
MLYLIKSIFKILLSILTLVFIWFLAMRYIFFDSFDATVEGIKGFFEALKVMYESIK